MTSELMPPNFVEQSQAAESSGLHSAFTGLRTRLGRVAAAGLLVGCTLADMASEDVASPPPAYADTLTYPWSDAAYVDANYDWGYSACPSTDPNCTAPFSGYKNGISYGESDPWGYYLRNCTSYVAFKLSTLGINSTLFRGLGNGGDWYNKALASERTSKPAAWDAAVEPATSSNPFGHVAFVESVNSDGTITVSEYNHDRMGNGDVRTGTPASMGFTEFVDFGVHPGAAASFSTVAAPAKNDLAWWTPDGTIYSMDNQGLGTQAQESGFEPPDWAGVMDYNGDGLDDIIQYRKSDGTVWALENDGHGNWNAVLARGPGVGPAEWAGVGDFDGDGKRNDLVWWTPDGTLYKFIGAGFRTASFATGLGTPDWAAIMDYNGDGRDDVVWYRASDGTLWVILNNPNGGWTLPSTPVRGPGVGPAEWAGVGDMDGDGRKNDLAWWTSDGTLYKFIGSDFHTASATSNLEPPNGAVIMDYNQDGRDDVIQYRKSDGTLWAIQNNPIGGWSSVLIRGPGVGPPSWFGTGNFDGK